ncbi:valine--tRNA ligase [Thermopetrobacter sp. TC1]|uniref:valine--tRNA ligase n=1 Tax=Thermopetrobacter sp. TC1 TaxID=1495045 RepID=UPI00056DF50B|nr:valine--tRNA ligase [Thermopetrobacter sp. TC1]
MLEKHFDPKTVEQRLYEAWEKAGAFQPSGKGEPFCIVIPPPNVTGSLHMGHALNNTLQDILVRFERMRGKDVLWQPGTDHAGIATQMVVERKLAAEGKPTRWEMGREKFLEEVWAWKEQSGNTIINQLKRLGASCDWSRLRFTMDEGLSRAVLKVFVTLWKEGLIYKDKRLVNWDPKLRTAISDLEVVPKETKGHLWHFRYPVEGEEGRYIVVATTRPETMLGDTAVAVHPDDPRYQDLIGKHVILPLVGRRIPIVADEHADPETGSGAVKITPAHDFDDFEVGKRHGLPMISVMDETAHMDLKDNADFLAGLEMTPEIEETLSYHGLDRFDARKKIVERMEKLGLLEKVEDHVHMVPYGDRGGVPVEPRLTEQWFVDAAALAAGALRVVERGDTKFFPANWTKTYFEWLRNIQPWCISRQLWWGHRIPAWYGPDGKIFVAETEEEALKQAKKHYGEPVTLERDPDVLDTWFSSALWPFSTLGWPDETPELKRYYPTSVLITGFDIIFFWVARMMMMGLHFMHDVPFHDVYIHALVRDEHGQKMSKSKGNVIDPLDLIEKYGADALRFTLAIMAVMGRDIRLSESRVEGYRNFGTKLWNAVRFLEMNEIGRYETFDPAGARLSLNRWIIGEAVKTAREVTQSLEDYRFNDAAAAIYRFTWDVFCDWYLELIKPVLREGDAAAQEETHQTAGWIRDIILKLLHPFMPFITEELWQRTGGEGFLMLQPWPEVNEALIDEAAAEELNWVITFIREVRSTRSEMNVPAGAQIPAVLVSADEESRRRLKEWKTEIMRLARLSDITLADEVPPKAAQIVLAEAIIALPLEGVIDLDAEIKRLEKELAAAEKEIRSLEGRLSNENFLTKAKPEVVEQTRQRLAEMQTRREKLEEARARLAAMA